MGSEGGNNSQAIRPQAAMTSEARYDARQPAIHVHYGVYLCEPFSYEIHAKLARDSRKIHIHSRFTCVLACGLEYEFCTKFSQNLMKIFQFLPGAFVPWNHASRGL